MSMLARFSTTGSAPVYVDDVFSTYLYEGNNTTQTINNGIDLSGRGGMVWIRQRNLLGGSHVLTDTVRGATKYINSASTDAETTNANTLTAFNSNGFSVGSDALVNANLSPFAAWTFRRSPKFFDVVTYTGDDNFSGRQIAHSLGSAPGCIMVKRTSGAKDWEVWHRSLTDGAYLQLNSQTAQVAAGGFDYFGAASTQTSTYFTLGDLNDDGVNRLGQTYVAYLFAHDTNADGLIQCGSFTTDGAGDATVTLGWEPQWLLRKDATNGATDWHLYDSMRGLTVAGQADVIVYPNSTASEGSGSQIGLTSTGFTVTGFSVSSAFIYIAIRRPNKPPTTAASVFSLQTYTGTGVTRTLDATIVPDVYIGNTRSPGSSFVGRFVDRLRGNSRSVRSHSQTAETGTSPSQDFSGQTGFTLTTTSDNTSASTYVSWFLRRAPGFFDVVCYTGTGTITTINHNLGVVPELIIIKNRSASSSWAIYASAYGPSNVLFFDNTVGNPVVSTWNNTAPTASVFSLGSGGAGSIANGPSSPTYVAYLFATCPNVSKVGGYTGNGGTVNTNGTSQTIDCGFSGGPRFVLIKRTDSTGDWYAFDTARGIVSGNDPYLLLNSFVVEVTTVDAVDPDNSGFIVNQTSGTNLNVTGANYIYLAIA